MSKLTKIVVAIAFASLASCETPRYGSRKFRVTLKSDPDGATLYLVERDAWKKLALPAIEQDLASFRVTDEDGVAPITTVLPSYQYVLVGEKDGERGQVDIRPLSDSDVFVVPIAKLKARKN